jgi:hypothetical protein
MKPARRQINVEYSLFGKVLSELFGILAQIKMRIMTLAEGSATTRSANYAKQTAKSSAK